jgi:hypothetical protein
MKGRGIDFIGPMGAGVAQSAGQMKRRGVDLSFYPEAFHHDAVSDTYRCPVLFTSPKVMVWMEGLAE